MSDNRYLLEYVEELEEGWGGGILGFLAGGPIGGALGAAAGYGLGAAIGANPANSLAVGALGAQVGGLAGTIGGSIIGHKIQKYSQMKSALGLKRCGNNINCKKNAIQNIINEIRKGMTVCNKTDDVVKCKSLANERLDYYENFLKKLDKRKK